MLNDNQFAFISVHATICILLAGYLATQSVFQLAAIATFLVAFDIAFLIGDARVRK
jgi:hypothetical protein